MLKRNSFFLAVVFVLLSCTGAAFASESGSNDAVVTVIQGSAKVYAKGTRAGKMLKKGDVLKKDDEVRVAEKSRIEIRFPDGTIMRLSEKSGWKMNELAYNKQTDEKQIKVGLSVGKLWANVKKLTSANSAVEVRTSNAVAGVRGTEYRVNVNDDKSVLVKVYDGTVYVANPPRDASKPIDKAVMPHEVSGPHEIPPPVHEVSMEEWTVIVKAMQQISISPQGVASKPQDFDAKTDADDWVRWNQERDKEAQP
jgi:ferric-dicitrate binding protein FerR (iron transport regulator)